MTYKSSVLAASGLVGYWRLAEASGTTVTDETGTNTGSYVASPTLAQAGHTVDADSKSVTFNGTSQYALLRTGTPIVGGLTNHTIIAWVSGAGTSARRPLYAERPSSGNDIVKLEVNITSGIVAATYRDDAGTLNQPAGTKVITGGPHMVVQVKTGTNITWYVDGVADSGTGTLTASNNFTNANIQARIGADAASQFLAATLSEVALFNRALTAVEIKSLYTVGVGVIPGVASLVITAFVPAVALSNNQLVTPGVASVTLATFASTVTASDHKTVTPGVTALALTAFAPTVAVTDQQTVIPDAVALALTAFAPTVTASDQQTVIPGTSALSLTAFAPNVATSNQQVVTPGTADLILTTFAPLVTASRTALPRRIAGSIVGVRPGGSVTPIVDIEAEIAA